MQVSRGYVIYLGVNVCIYVHVCEHRYMNGKNHSYIYGVSMCVYMCACVSMMHQKNLKSSKLEV